VVLTVAPVDPYSRGARAVGIALRTAHLLAMAVFVGGVHLGVADAAVRPWLTGAALTGFLLLASELTHGGGWAWQVRGVAVLVHVAALALLAVGGLDRAAVTIALVVGALGSHAPKSIRRALPRVARLIWTWSVDMRKPLGRVLSSSFSTKLLPRLSLGVMAQVMWYRPY
jgi:hypothetical protein